MLHVVLTTLNGDIREVDVNSSLQISDFVAYAQKVYDDVYTGVDASLSCDNISFENPLQTLEEIGLKENEVVHVLFSDSFTAQEIRKHREIFKSKQRVAGEMLLERMKNVMTGETLSDVYRLPPDVRNIDVIDWVSSHKFRAFRDAMREADVAIKYFWIADTFDCQERSFKMMYDPQESILYYVSHKFFTYDCGGRRTQVQQTYLEDAINIKTPKIPSSQVFPSRVCIIMESFCGCVWIFVSLLYSCLRSGSYFE